jgi:hypothetical protein
MIGHPPGAVPFSPAPAPGFIADQIRLAPAPVPIPALTALVPTVPDEGPDGEIRAAWADYVTACRAYSAGDVTPENEEVFEAPINEAEGRLLAAQVTTIEGIALKLRWHMGDWVKTEAQAVAVRNGEIISPEEGDDPVAQSMARFLRDVERMVSHRDAERLAGALQSPKAES